MKKRIITKSSITIFIFFALSLLNCNSSYAYPANENNIDSVLKTPQSYSSDEEKTIKINNIYLKAGEELIINNPSNYNLKYYVDGSEINTDKFLLSDNYYEKWITVKAFDSDVFIAEDKVYFSNLPVIYIDTNDGKCIDSKTEYTDGTMVIQNNNETFHSEYNGKISIKGRGNTSWGWPKKPYRIKLDKKTDLFGMGANKNWVLISNYLDECFLRNKTAYDLSKELGLESMDCIWSDVILNGDYIGNYLLCEQIRIDENRINIFDWESEAEMVSKSIVKSEKKKGNLLDQTALEKQLESDLSWITSGYVSYDGAIYKTNIDYNDISGGYLFELSNEYDEVSKFTTESQMKIMIKSPEHLNTNQAMMNYVIGYWNDFEKAYHSDDGYVETKDGPKHYTELADIDSMISYWLVMEIMGNDDSIYKSRFAYKDMNSKIVFGPVWDFDWGCASMTVSTSPYGWRVSKSTNEQSFYREFLDDPLFISKATEKYWQIRPYLEKMIMDDGVLDSNINYLRKSGIADEERWNRNIIWPEKSRGFNKDASIFKNYLIERIAWLDKQFESDLTLLNSTFTESSSSPYSKADDKIIITIQNSNAYTLNHYKSDTIIRKGEDIIAFIKIDDPETIILNIYINGIFYNSISSSDSYIIKIPNNYLSSLNETKNVISLIGKSSLGNTTYRNFFTAVQIESSEPITTTTIQSTATSTINYTQTTLSTNNEIITVQSYSNDTNTFLTTTAIKETTTTSTSITHSDNEVTSLPKTGPPFLNFIKIILVALVLMVMGTCLIIFSHIRITAILHSKKEKN